MIKWIRIFVTGLAGAGLLGVSASVLASEQDELVTQAQTTFNNIKADPDLEWFRENVKKAHGVVIAPSVVKAGFILGGSGGRAVLLKRDAKSKEWYGPAFYTLATGSVGFQAGVAKSETVMLIMNEKAMNSFLSSSFKLGGDVSVAAGPVGAGAKSNVKVDVYTYSRAKGLYGGLNLDGTAVTVNDDFNEAYYGKPVTPVDILVKRNVSNPQAKGLKADVAAAAR